MIRIESLADCLDMVDTIARWHWEEWGHLDPTGSLQSWTEGLKERTKRDAIPTTYIALDDNKLIGSATLVNHDMSTRLDLSPWLAGVYVKPEYRGRGVGRALVRHAVSEATEMGVKNLYLYTNSAKEFYEKLGWRYVAEDYYEGRPVFIMDIETAVPADRIRTSDFAKNKRDLLPRVISGIALLALVLIAISLQRQLLLFLVALAAALAAHEFYKIVRCAGYLPWYPAGIALALLLAMRGYIGGKDLLSGVPYTGPGTGVEVTVLAMVLVLVLVRQGAVWLRASATARLSSNTVTAPSSSTYVSASGWTTLGLTLGGAIYTGGLLGYVPILAALQEGPDRAGGATWLLAVIVGTAACDTGAYAIGKLLGKSKLIPHISPAKTWEGLAGGTLGAVIAAIALSGLLKLSLVSAIILGLVICAAAVAGDLCESLLKRVACVKDSGRLIPGHGGLLDRIDSIVFVLVAVFWFTQVVVR